MLKVTKSRFYPTKIPISCIVLVVELFNNGRHGSWENKHRTYANHTLSRVIKLQFTPFISPVYPSYFTRVTGRPSGLVYSLSLSFYLSVRLFFFILYSFLPILLFFLTTLRWSFIVNRARPYIHSHITVQRS